MKLLHNVTTQSTYPEDEAALPVQTTILIAETEDEAHAQLLRLYLPIWERMGELPMGACRAGEFVPLHLVCLYLLTYCGAVYHES